MKCKNCDHIVEGNYCTFCGQSIRVDKVTFPNLLSELSESVFQVNRGLLFTIKELFIRPGKNIREYLNGKRKNHFKPIAYALALSTIYFLLSQIIGGETFLNDLLEGAAQAGKDNKTTSPVIIAFTWFADNYAITMLLLLPLFALASYLAFEGSGFNYLEHFVLNSYIIGQQAIIYAIISMLGLIVDNNDIIAMTSLGFSMLYALIVFWQFFIKPRRISVIFRFLLTYILYFILLFVVFIIWMSIAK